jgi:hypothetical protein
LVHGEPPAAALGQPWLVPVPPDRRRELLATPLGLLSNELDHDPIAVVMPLVAQAAHVAGLSVGGGYDSGFVQLLLFLVRTLVRLQAFVVAASGALARVPNLCVCARAHGCVCSVAFARGRDAACAPSTARAPSPARCVCARDAAARSPGAALSHCSHALATLFDSLLPAMLRFADEADGADDTAAACGFHTAAVSLLRHRLCLDAADAVALEASAAYVVTWFTPTQGGGAFDSKFTKVGQRWG